MSTAVICLVLSIPAADLLGSDDWETREAAHAYLAATWRLHVGELTAAQKSESAEVRLRADRLLRAYHNERAEARMEAYLAGTLKIEPKDAALDMDLRRRLYRRLVVYGFPQECLSQIDPEGLVTAWWCTPPTLWHAIFEAQVCEARYLVTRKLPPPPRRVWPPAPGVPAPMPAPVVLPFIP